MPYVILEQGSEYNDEYYSIGGDDATVLKNGYTNLEDARAKVKEKLRDSLKNFEFYSFSEDGSGYYDALDMYAGWTEYEGRYDWEFLETGWSDFIKEAEKRDVEWVTLVPQLFSIIEVTFDD